jgi:tetraacyldisaccharide 4'-kinase
VRRPVSLRNAVEKLLLSIWFPVPSSSLRVRLVLRLLGALLLPWSWLSRPIMRYRRSQISHTCTPGSPVVLVVGNLVVGGAGKTPVTLAIASRLSAAGIRVGLLCNAYRAEGRTAQLVDSNSDPRTVGDEALLLALASGLPVASGRRRDEALALLIAQHPALQLVISDDGLQHTRLPRRLELAVFDARGAGNRRLLPAGPLREPLADALHMAAVLLNGTRNSPVAHPQRFHFSVRATAIVPLDEFARRTGSKTVALESANEIQLAAAVQALRTLPASRRLALAGIAQPQRFADTLAALGLACTLQDLGDHARLDSAMIQALDADVILMTSKDAVKLLNLSDKRCWVVVVAAAFDDDFYPWLHSQLKPLLEGVKHG